MRYEQHWNACSTSPVDEDHFNKVSFRRCDQSINPLPTNVHTTNHQPSASRGGQGCHMRLPKQTHSTMLKQTVLRLSHNTRDIAIEQQRSNSDERGVSQSHSQSISDAHNDLLVAALSLSLSLSLTIHTILTFVAATLRYGCCRYVACQSSSRSRRRED